MTIDDAREYAISISRTYGRTVVFREPGKTESYQAMAADLPVGSTIMEAFEDGKPSR